MDSDQLDGITSIRTYVDRLVTGDGRCNGMKVLLLDGATTQILSCVSTQSEILTHEVYLVSRLDDPRCNPNLKGSNNNNSATDENGGKLFLEYRQDSFKNSDFLINFDYFTIICGLMISFFFSFFS